MRQPEPGRLRWRDAELQRRGALADLDHRGDRLGGHRNDGTGEQGRAQPDRPPGRGHENDGDDGEHDQDVARDHQARVRERVARGDGLRGAGRGPEREGVPRRCERDGRAKRGDRGERHGQPDLQAAGPAGGAHGARPDGQHGSGRAAGPADHAEHQPDADVTGRDAGAEVGEEQAERDQAGADGEQRSGSRAVAALDNEGSTDRPSGQVDQVRYQLLGMAGQPRATEVAGKEASDPDHDSGREQGSREDRRPPCPPDSRESGLPVRWRGSSGRRLAQAERQA